MIRIIIECDRFNDAIVFARALGRVDDNNHVNITGREEIDPDLIKMVNDAANRRAK